MDNRQRQRILYRSFPKGYYHLCTDGWSSGKLFNNSRQFARGMSLVSVLPVKYNVTIYSFELMPNHIHIALSGTGEQCLECYYFLIRNINKLLVNDGFPQIPDDYWFKLIPIDDKEFFKQLIIYIARNDYEKGNNTPCGYPWGSSYLLYNDMSTFLGGTKAAEMKKGDVEKMTGCKVQLPEEWIIHPELGVLPSNFICLDKLKELFPSAKEYMTRMVKDYESYVKISKLLGEELEWSVPEARDIANTVCVKMFPGRFAADLNENDKCKLAVKMNADYNMDAKLLAQALYVPAKVITQVLNAKDYGVRHW